jgi:ribosomal protein L11 methylase PrmA
VIYQLRDYIVKQGEMQDWLDEWRDVIVPLREKAGFDIVGAWIVPDEDRFIWIIGREDFESADEAYYASPERAALDPDPARHLAHVDTKLMTRV